MRRRNGECGLRKIRERPVVDLRSRFPHVLSAFEKGNHETSPHAHAEPVASASQLQAGQTHRDPVPAAPPFPVAAVAAGVPHRGGRLFFHRWSSRIGGDAFEGARIKLRGPNQASGRTPGMGGEPTGPVHADGPAPTDFADGGHLIRRPSRKDSRAGWCRQSARRFEEPEVSVQVLTPAASFCRRRKAVERPPFQGGLSAGASPAGDATFLAVEPAFSHAS